MLKRKFGTSDISIAPLQKGAPLNKLDDASLYGGGLKGYTDYPKL